MRAKLYAERYVYLCLLGVLFIAYFPVVQGYYLIYDDMWSFVYEYNKLSDNHMFKTQAYSAGRPLGAYGMSFLLSFVKTVNHANYIRGFLIVVLSIALFLLYIMLFRFNDFSRLNSLLVAAAMGTLPSFYSGIYCITDSYSIYGLLPGLLAGLAAYKILEQEKSNKVLWFAAVVVLLLISLLTYPMAAMFYWVLLWIFIAKKDIVDLVKIKKQILISSIAPIISMCIYLAYFKIFQTQYSANELTLDLLAKLKWFVIGPLPVSLSLWDRPLKVSYNPDDLWSLYGKTALFVGTVIILGFITGITKEYKRNSKYNFAIAIKYTMLILLPLLSMSPLLLSTWPELSYRYLTPLMGIVFISFIWSLYNLLGGLIKRYGHLSLTFAIASLCVIGIYSANNMVSKEIVKPLSLELQYFKNILKGHDLASRWLIHIVASERSFPKMESLGFLSSFGHIVGKSDWGPALVMTAIKELSLEEASVIDSNIYNIGKVFEIVTTSTKSDIATGAVDFNKNDSIITDMTSIEQLVFKSDAVLSASPFLPRQQQKSLQINNHTNRNLLNSNMQYSDNLCRNGKPLSGGDYPGFPAIQAFDGDKVSTRWGFAQTGLHITGSAFIGCDFGENIKRNIRRITIRQGGALSEIKVQRSNDNRLWTDVKRLNLVLDSNVRNYDLPPSVPSRYWRLLADSTVGEGPSAWTIYEIEMKEALK